MTTHNTDDENTIEFWKEKYEELNTQYDDFQKHSLELENELELQLKHSDEKIKELENRNNRLMIDNDTLKTKLNELNKSTHKQISQLQEDLAKFKAVKDEMQKYIRELEQKNDDLERTNRCAMFSLGEFESKMNEALERNAILESELDEKDELAETVQRLRDEARDLKQELAVRQQKAQKDLLSQSKLSNTIDITNTNNNDTNNNTINNQSNSSNMMETEQQEVSNDSTKATTLNIILNDLQLQQQQLNQKLNGDSTNNSNTLTINPSATKSNGYSNNNNNTFSQRYQEHHPVTPSLRISALNFVGDALRKVTSMESRLVATRNLMKESNRDRRSATISNVESNSYNNATNSNIGVSNNVNNASSSSSSVTKTNPPPNIVNVY